VTEAQPKAQETHETFRNGSLLGGGYWRGKRPAPRAVVREETMTGQSA